MVYQPPVGTVRASPTGMSMVIYAGDGVDLPANGQRLSKAKYPKLYGALLGRFGESNKFFHVPDMRGSVVTVGPYTAASGPIAKPTVTTGTTQGHSHGLNPLIPTDPYRQESRQDISDAQIQEAVRKAIGSLDWYEIMDVDRALPPDRANPLHLEVRRRVAEALSTMGESD